MCGIIVGVEFWGLRPFAFGSQTPKFYSNYYAAHSRYEYFFTLQTPAKLLWDWVEVKSEWLWNPFFATSIAEILFLSRRKERFQNKIQAQNRLIFWSLELPFQIFIGI